LCGVYVNASPSIKYTLGVLAKGKKVKDITTVRHRIKSVKSHFISSVNSILS